jgi:hypothetical protein
MKVWKLGAWSGENALLNACANNFIVRESCEKSEEINDDDGKGSCSFERGTYLFPTLDFGSIL